MLKTGLYRNRQGAEMYVLGQAAPILIPIEVRTAFPPVKPQFDFLGGSIYLAENRHELFGDQHYLVTQEDMEAAGYELVKEAPSEEDAGGF